MADETIHSEEPYSAEYNAWVETYENELRTLLQGSGIIGDGTPKPTEDFLRVLFTDTSDINGVDRHSVRMTLYRHSEHREDVQAPDEKSLARAYRLGGGFFTSLWEDGARRAEAIADSNNTQLLEKAGFKN